MNASADKPSTVTRARAERALAAGADPQQFANHPNYHVRRKAWRKAGFQLLSVGNNTPQNREQDERLLRSLKLDPEKYLLPAEPSDAAVLEQASSTLDSELHTDIPEVIS